jgi:hypothetical protein
MLEHYNKYYTWNLYLHTESQIKQYYLEVCPVTLVIVKLIARLGKCYYYREGKWLYKKHVNFNISFVMPSARRKWFHGNYTD